MRVVVSLLLCLLLGACASSRRMMKISPFATGEAAQMPDPDRVNVWPLVYHDRDATSVLWPIIDWDKQGFAVRPLINKEGDDWSVLFPLSGWNTTDWEGWVLTAYHNDRSTGIFPFFNIGEDFNYIIPVWWTSDDEHGVFPLYGWGDHLRHIGPVWWEPDGTEAGLFPVYDQNLSAKWRCRNVLFGSLAHFRDRDHGTYTHWLFPCWYSTGDEAGKTRLLLPVFVYVHDGSERMLLTPLGGRGWTDDGDTFMVNVLGPLYHSHHHDGHSFHALLWPVFTVSDGDTWRVWPVVARTGDKGRPGPLHDLVLLGLTDRADRRGVSCLGPWVVDYSRRVHDDDRPDWQLSFLLFGRLWHTVYADDGVPHPRDGWRQSCVERQGHNVILAYHDRETFRTWRPGVLSRDEMQTLFTWWHGKPSADRTQLAAEVADILRRHGASATGDDQALLAFVKANTTLTDTVRMGVPLLYKLRRSGDDSDWQVLLGAVSGKRTGDRSRLSVLRYLYRRDRKGEQISRDFFPFFTWDSAPDHSRISFLSRCFDFRRDQGRRSGHILFIPWGG